MNKKIILYLTILLWIIIATVIIIHKQTALANGTPVLLETVPVDPRDLLRGDYVTLRYKISMLDLDKIKKDKNDYGSGDLVYIKLEPKGKY